MKTRHALVLGAVTVATVEAIETSAFWWWYRQVTPARIFRFIAAGLLGRSAFDGGSSSVWLGVTIHLFNAFVIVAVYFLASRGFPTLIRRPVPWGLAYGAGVHLVMEFAVIPLSSAPHSAGVKPLLLLHSLVSQAVTVGLPSATFARAASRDPSMPPQSSSERARTIPSPDQWRSHAGSWDGVASDQQATAQRSSRP